MRRTVSMIAVLSLGLVGCGGGSSESGDDAVDGAGASENAAASGSGSDAGSDFCNTVLDLVDELGGVDAEYVGDDFYGEIGDVYARLAADAPDDLSDDFDRVIDGFEKIRDWSEDPTSEYPFSDAEDAELETSMERIDAAIGDDCGIDTGGSEDDGPPTDAVDEAATDDSITMGLEGDDGSGEVSLGGELPDDFPFPVPDTYEVGSSSEFTDATGTMFIAVLHAPEEDFDAVKTLYEDFLNEEGFEVAKTDMSSDEGKFVFLVGERSDVQASISMSTEEVANDAAGNLIYETNVSLTWTPSS
jgi:hypothetical protein